MRFYYVGCIKVQDAKTAQQDARLAQDGRWNGQGIGGDQTLSTGDQ